jgi:hypothetical protein
VSGPRVVLGHPVEGPRIAVATVLLSASVWIAATTSAPWWVVALGVVGPDLAFLAALGTRPEAPGLMPRQMVRVYNATHHLAGPWLLTAAAVLLVSAPLAAGALAWHAHVQWDRGVGYGLRDADGRIVPPVRWSARRPARALASSRR